MSANPIVAKAILAAAEPLMESLNSLVAKIAENDAKAAKVSVKVSDLTEAMNKSDDKSVKAALAAIAKAQETITAQQKAIRDARNSAQAVLFPDSVVVDTLSDEERKALITEAAETRKAIVNIHASAKLTDPDVEVPEIPAVVGMRGRPAGFKSTTAGKPKPRVSAITLDGKPVEPKATFGNLQKSIHAVTGVSVDNDIVVDAFTKALNGADWKSDAVKGSTVEFPLTVTAKDGERTLTVAVTV